MRENVNRLGMTGLKQLKHYVRQRCIVKARYRYLSTLRDYDPRLDPSAIWAYPEYGTIKGKRYGKRWNEK